MIECKGCLQQATGNYCQNCGENLNQPKLELKFLLKDAISSVLDLKTPLIRTIYELLFKPGLILNSFILGKRKVYYKPVSFYILVISIYYLIYFWVGMDRDDILLHYGGYEGKSTGNELTDQWFANFGNYLRKYIKFIGIVIIPIQALVATWVIKKSKFNFTETFVVWIYGSGILSFIGIFLMWIAFINPSFFYNFSYLLATIYFAYLIKSVYGLSFVKSLWKSILIQLFSMSMFFFICLILLIGFFVVVNIAK